MATKAVGSPALRSGRTVSAASVSRPNVEASSKPLGAVSGKIYRIKCFKVSAWKYQCSRLCKGAVVRCSTAWQLLHWKHALQTSNASLYRVSQKKVAPLRFSDIFLKRLGIFQPNFTCLLHVSIYDRLQIFIQFTPTLMKLCHIKRNNPVHTVSAKCPPSVKTHAGIFWRFFPKQLGIFSPNFTCLLYVPVYARIQIFIQLPTTVTKLCHIKCDHPACISADGRHYEHMMVVALNRA